MTDNKDFGAFKSDLIKQINASFDQTIFKKMLDIIENSFNSNVKNDLIQK